MADVVHQVPAATAVPRRRRSAAGRRFGYVLGAGVDVVALYVVHHLLEWGWPRFLTGAFDEVLPVLTASIVVGIVTNLVLVVGDPGWLKALTNAITAAFGFAVAWRTMQVFPFDFASYDHDWSWLVTLVLVVGMVGAAIGGLVELVRFLTWPFVHRRSR